MTEEELLLGRFSFYPFLPPPRYRDEARKTSKEGSSNCETFAFCRRRIARSKGDFSCPLLRLRRVDVEL